jgi:serine/threonine-protein kinase
MDQVLSQEPRPPSGLRRGLSRDLEAVCLKCLEKRSERRYPSAEALADDLGRWVRGEPTRVRPLRWPGRGLRAVRRHAAKILLALAPAVAPALLLTSYLRDPSRRPEDPWPELAAGKEVTVVGTTGQPRWFKARAGAADLSVSTTPDDAFSVQSSKLALVELVPHPLSGRYRFSAEVRHDEAGRTEGDVGVYFMYSNYNTSQGRLVHYFCALSFNDLRGVANPPPGRDSRGTWRSLPSNAVSKRSPTQPASESLAWSVISRPPGTPGANSTSRWARTTWVFSCRVSSSANCPVPSC